MAELRARRDAVAGADLIELRLDSVADPDVSGALEGCDRTRVIVTCRPTWEGGHFSGSESDRKRILTEALQQGARFVDIELSAGFEDLIRSTNGRRIVLSLHDFEGVPADLSQRVREMRSTGAEVVKVAVLASSLSDNLPLLKLKDHAGRSVFVGMGEPGIPTRVLAAHFGSFWSYAGEGHAPGQIAASRMLNEFRFRQLDEQTAIYGIVGTPLGHSVSPAMHNAAFASFEEKAVYLPFQAADADDFLRFAEAIGVRGASVTIPYKVDLFHRADSPDALSRRVGAINTLKADGKKWHARNTDVSGFLRPLVNRLQLRGARASILGSGGAARAVAVALGSAGATVTVAGRNRARAEEVARLAEGTATERPLPRGSWDLLVNATPVGTFPRADESPLPHGPFDGRVVYDLVYNPEHTRLLSDAAAAGCETIGGLDMLVAQAEDQCEWWTGRRPAAGLMRQAALTSLGLTCQHVGDL
jgi:3-dehydroquinate dehydratase/shikimate dehydrogenase